VFSIVHQNQPAYSYPVFHCDTIRLAMADIAAVSAFIFIVSTLIGAAGACTLSSTPPPSSCTPGACNSYSANFWNEGTVITSQPIQGLSNGQPVTCSTGFTVVVAQFHNFGTQNYQLTTEGGSTNENVVVSQAGSCLDLGYLFAGQTAITVFTMQGYGASIT
jgi:hypothetical protein